MHSNSATTYRCFGCAKDIIDHVNMVQRRKIRPVPPNASPMMKDAVDPSHGGVILGPEFDPYCDICYAKIPTIQELLNAHKKRVDKERENLD